MHDHDKLYGTAYVAREENNCIEGFWEAVRSFQKEHPSLRPTFVDQWPHDMVFYNNFEISHRSVWNSTAYREYFDFIDHTGRIYTHRWYSLKLSGSVPFLPSFVFLLLQGRCTY
jgi:hypothetical protein